MHVREFFDELSGEYTATLARCVPRYQEMLWALLIYLPARLRPTRILELGCGTGNLSLALRTHFDAAALTLVDVSPAILAKCQARLGAADELRFVQADFRDLEVEPGSFDLVVSSIAIHHLDSAGKRRLFERVFTALRPGGVFAFSDQFSGATQELYAKHMELWHEHAVELGANEGEWAMWMEHQRSHDHHEPLQRQLRWLAQAGFENVDCVWRFLLWTVVQGVKPYGAPSLTSD